MARGLANLHCELHPFAGLDRADIEASGLIQRLRSGLWDIVVIDGYVDHGKVPFGLTRPLTFHAALEHTAPGGFIVLDDSWMFPALLIPRSGWSIQNFVGLGPQRYGVTSTAIFQRRDSN